MVFDGSTDEAEVVYADDVMHAFVHKDAGFVVESICFQGSVLVQVAGRHGLTLNFDLGETEAVLAIRGKGPRRSGKSCVMK